MTGDPLPSATSTRGTESYYRRGLALRAEGLREEALEMYREALLLDSTHRPSLLELGSVLGQLDRWADARRVYQRAHRLFPEDEEFRQLLLRAVARYGERAHVPEDLLADTLPEKSGAAGRKLVLVKARPSFRYDERSLRRRAGIGGFLAFALVVYSYITIGLITHIVAGLAAAGAIAAVLAATGTLFFPGRRRLAFRAILRGMFFGFVATLLIGLGSVIIGLVTAAGQNS